MIKKGISFWSFPDGTTIAQGIKTSKTAGFEGIELLLVKDGLWGATEGDGIEEAKRVANCEGIEIASVTMGPNWWEGMLICRKILHLNWPKRFGRQQTPMGLQFLL